MPDGTALLNRSESQSVTVVGAHSLDLTKVIMNPPATQILDDVCAEIIKVESGFDDFIRLVGSEDYGIMEPLFLQSEHNKCNIVLDFKSNEGHALLMGFIPRAQVFDYNIRPQAMQRFGLDDKTIGKINPRIIFCAAAKGRSEGPNIG